MTTFPPEDPGRDDETPAEERAEDEQSSVDESIPETPAEDSSAADEQLANETPDDADTTPLEDAREVEAEDEAAEEETEERADLASASESDIVAEAEAILSVGPDRSQEADADAAEPMAVVESPAVPAEEIVEVTSEPSLEDAELVDVTEVEEEEPAAPAEPSPYDRPGNWFVVHTYAGYENKVKQNLASRVRSMNVEDRIYEVVIPMEDVIEFKGGRKVVVQKKVFPGYLLVRQELDDDSWYVVRNTPGVTGSWGAGPSRRRCPAARSRTSWASGRSRAPRWRRRRPVPGWSSRPASRCGSWPGRSPTSTARSARSTTTSRSSRCS